MYSRITLASGCEALNTTAEEAQCDVQMSPPTMKQETVHCCDENETNCGNHLCQYKSLKSPNCINYYDDQFCVLIDVKGEYPEDGCPQSSTAASCINKSSIISKTVFENDELSRVIETQEIKQEVSEEAFSIIETEEIHDKKDQFIATTEVSEEYRILGNAGDTSGLHKVQKSAQEIQPKMCGGILKTGFNSLTHSNEHIKIKPPTLVDNEGKELQKCRCCDENCNHNNMLAHVDDVHSHKNHKSRLYHENIRKIRAGSNVDEINYKCNSCKRIYKSKSALVLHFKTNHYNYERICECWCGKQFRTPIHLRQHETKIHGAIVSSTIKTALKNNYQCDICKKTFKRKVCLKRHILSVHYDYDKTFKCWCGKQFRTPIHLRQHKNKQHGANSNSTNNVTLKKEFQCDICKKTFGRKCILQIHIERIHCDHGKTFNCWCGKQFRTPKHLYQHKFKQHAANAKSRNFAALKTEFQCEICEKTLKSKDGLKTHITSIHYDYGKSFNCSCGKQFRTPRQLYQHKYRQHGVKAKSTNNTT